MVVNQTFQGLDKLRRTYRRSAPPAKCSVTPHLQNLGSSLSSYHISADIIRMSGPQSRLSRLAAHLLPSSTLPQNHQHQHPNNFHTLSPTSFLPRAAAIEPDVSNGPIDENGFADR